jgi:hypothetical protein
MGDGTPALQYANGLSSARPAAGDGAQRKAVKRPIAERSRISLRSHGQLNQETPMNAMIETMESRQMMSVTPMQVTSDVQGLWPRRSAQILPYIEQGNVYKQAAGRTQTNGIIGVLVALVSAPASAGQRSVQPAAGRPATGTGTATAVTGDWNGDGRDLLGVAARSAGYKLTEVMISSVVSKTAKPGVFAGAASARMIMIQPAVDGTSNTLMHGES